MKGKKCGKGRKGRRIAVTVILLSLIVVFVGFFILHNAKSALTEIAEARVRMLTNTCVNLAVYQTLDSVSYNDLVTVQKDGNGDIALLSVNSALINRIARDTARIAQENLEKYGKEGIPVPIGAFTGIKLLAGSGPAVRFGIIPVGSVSCDFLSEYKSVGINQTLHKIYVEAVAEVDVIFPGESLRLCVPTEIFVCESVLVGKVPKTYLDAGLFRKTFDFSKSDKIY